MSNNNEGERISFDDMKKAELARRAIENPWTPEDEARYTAKAKAEREAREKWEAANPQAETEDEDDEEEDSE